MLNLRARLRPDVSLAQARAEVRQIGQAWQQAHPADEQNRGLILRTHFEARQVERGYAVTVVGDDADDGAGRAARRVRQRGRAAHEPGSRTRARDCRAHWPWAPAACASSASCSPRRCSSPIAGGARRRRPRLRRDPPVPAAHDHLGHRRADRLQRGSEGHRRRGGRVRRERARRRPDSRVPLGARRRSLGHAAERRRERRRAGGSGAATRWSPGRWRWRSRSSPSACSSTRRSAPSCARDRASGPSTSCSSISTRRSRATTGHARRSSTNSSKTACVRCPGSPRWRSRRSFRSTRTIATAWRWCPRATSSRRASTTVRMLASRVDEGYFDTMRVRLVAGRGFLSTDTDRRAGGRRSSTKPWRRSTGPGSRPSASACGFADGTWRQVVGIAANTKYNTIAEVVAGLRLPRRAAGPGHPHDAARRRVGRERLRGRSGPRRRPVARSRRPDHRRVDDGRVLRRERRHADALSDRRRRRHGRSSASGWPWSASTAWSPTR